jgi:hypothetical protein
VRTLDTSPPSSAPAGEPFDAGGTPDAQALIEEARRLHRQRRRRRLGLVAVLVVVVAAMAAGLVALTSTPPPARPSHPAAAPRRHVPPAADAMPAYVVVWRADFSLVLVSSRTGRTERTLADGVAEDRGLPALASAGGFVYYDDAHGPTSQVLRIPAGGGAAVVVGAGRLPAVSPNGEWLAYATDTSLSDAPESIVVTNLVTGAVRTWSFTTSRPDIAALSWAPDNRTLAFTATAASSDGRTLALSTRLLAVPTFSGSLDDAPVLPLPPTLQWAGYVSAARGVAVRPTAGGVTLVEVSTMSGRVIRQVATLPDELSTANALDGTEGTIQTDPSGRDLLISMSPPAGGPGVVARITLTDPKPVVLTRGALRAAWVG